MIDHLVRRRLRRKNWFGKFHEGVIGCLLSFAIVVCLWRLWSDTVDPSDVASATTTAPIQPYQQPLVPVFVDGSQRPFFNNPNHIPPTLFPISSQPRGASVRVGQGANLLFVLERKSDHLPFQFELPTIRSKTMASATNLIGRETDQHSSPSRLVFLCVASISLSLGAILAKRLLDKWQRWEQQSQIDSLAYDIAYTDTFSEVGYGSFVSATWLDEANKFDV